MKFSEAICNGLGTDNYNQNGMVLSNNNIISIAQQMLPNINKFIQFKLF